MKARRDKNLMKLVMTEPTDRIRLSFQKKKSAEEIEQNKRIQEAELKKLTRTTVLKYISQEIQRLKQKRK